MHRRADANIHKTREVAGLFRRWPPRPKSSRLTATLRRSSSGCRRKSVPRVVRQGRLRRENRGDAEI